MSNKTMIFLPFRWKESIHKAKIDSEQPEWVGQATMSSGFVGFRMPRIFLGALCSLMWAADIWVAGMPAAAVAETVKIAGYEIQGLISQSSPEIYNKVMDELLDRMDVRLTVLPMARA